MHLFMHGGHGSHDHPHDDIQRPVPAVEAGRENR
jgi:hypothetical protein